MVAYGTGASMLSEVHARLHHPWEACIGRPDHRSDERRYPSQGLQPCDKIP